MIFFGSNPICSKQRLLSNFVASGYTSCKYSLLCNPIHMLPLCIAVIKITVVFNHSLEIPHAFCAVSLTVV